MVDHKIDYKIKVLADHVNVIPGAKYRVHFRIGQRGKPAIR